MYVLFRVIGRAVLLFYVFKLKCGLCFDPNQCMDQPHLHAPKKLSAAATVCQGL